MYLYIYGPSIRKTPHAHIHHPVLRIAARHHRLPSSLSGRHPRRSHTLPPTDIDPPPPEPLRTSGRQKTLATAYYFSYINIYSFTPAPSNPAGPPNLSSKAASITSICSHHLLGSPDPDGPTRAELVWKSEVEVVAGSTRPPPYSKDLRA